MYDQDNTFIPICSMEQPPELSAGVGTSAGGLQQLPYSMENCYVDYDNGHFLPAQEQNYNWDAGAFHPEQEFPATDPQAQDLLNIFRPSELPSVSFGLVPDHLFDAENSPAPAYDPLFHLNQPPKPPLFRELLHSLPPCYGLTSSEFNSERVFEFGREAAGAGGREVKGAKHYVNERERRVDLKGKFGILRNHVPNPGKDDRTSIVEDAIGYIKELKRRVNEQKILVERKRRMRLRRKRIKSLGAGEDVEAEEERCCDEPLRSSWLQRKSKDTEVDVRIVEDEVTIKLVQAKNINCLLHVSRVLDDLNLDLHHLAGGHINDHYSFLFNTKICEGSFVYASAVADKLIEVADGNQPEAGDSPRSF